MNITQTIGLDLLVGGWSCVVVAALEDTPSTWFLIATFMLIFVGSFLMGAGARRD